MKRFYLSLLIALISTVGMNAAVTDVSTDWLDYSKAFDSQLTGDPTSISVRESVAQTISLSMSSGGNDNASYRKIAYASDGGIKKPWLYPKNVYTISVSVGKIVAYEIVTRGKAANVDFVNFQLKHGDAGSLQTNTTNQALDTDVTTTVNSYDSNTITLDLSNWTGSGNQGILIKTLRLKLQYNGVQITYDYKVGGTSKQTETIVAPVGEPFPSPTQLPDYVEYILPIGNVVNDDDGQTKEITCNYVLPFTTSENFAGATWYYMSARNNDKWFYRSETNTIPSDGKRKYDIRAQWAFKGNPFDGIEVWNKAAGDGYTLGYDATSDGSATKMKKSTTTWKIEKQGTNGFMLRQAGANQYLHDYNNQLKFWVNNSAAADAGSAFKVEAVPTNSFAQPWGNYYPWKNQDVDNVPSGVVVCTESTAQGHVIRKAETSISVPHDGDDVTVQFNWTGGDHMLKIVGVDLLNSDGDVVKSDYHEGKAGSEANKNTYTLSGVTTGDYTLRYFVCHVPTGENNHDLTSTQGQIVVTNATRKNITVKYIFRLDGNEKAQETHDAIEPISVYPDFNTTFPYGVVVPNLISNIVDSEIDNGVVTKVFDLTENLPFIKSTSFDDAKWYVVDMHSNDSGADMSYQTYVWTYGESGTPNVTLPFENYKQSSLFDDTKLWCFIGDAISGFEIYNKRAGKTMKLYREIDGNLNDNAVAVMSSVNSTKFTLAASTEITGATCFLPKDHTNYLNTQSNGTNKVLSGWTATDGGSSCRFFAPTDFVKEALADYATMPVGAIGSPDNLPTYRSVVADAYEALKTDAWNTEAVTSGVTSAIQTLNSANTIEFTPGYYRIYSAMPGLYANNKGVYLNSENNFKWGTIETSALNAIMSLETSTADANKVVMKNVNKERYMQGVLGASNTIVGTNSPIALTSLGFGQYKLVFGNGTMHAEGHNYGNGSGGNLVNWDGSKNSASAWYIVPAKDLDIAIGATGYATTYLPFDVVIPNTSDLKAYAVTLANGTSATLTEKADIPAKHGAILKGTPNEDYKLNIATSSSDWSVSLLSGSCTDTYLTEDAYVLAKPVDGTVGLYKADHNKNGAGAAGSTHFKNNANKAYLPASAVTQGARVLTFNFDDNAETGINAVEIEEVAPANAAIYDLSGRRVQNAKSGLYIINGKKVIK